MDFFEELQWRGLIHDYIPGTDEALKKEKLTGYVGFDPTADSLHVGNLVPIILLMHFQRHGHKPLAVVGGATGMIGDPSGKSAERNLLDEETLRKNEEGIARQLRRFLDFDSGPNKAELLNNYDWFKDMGFIDFVRNIGKHITVNYMMSKDSVKKRLRPESDNEGGMSFTEFTYQLMQGYDFLHLYRTKNCTLQMGGSDQWGNITTGTELIRRIARGKAYALTAPLITKSDGSKFGKTESGNVWLDPARTSPYKFYQYWINVSDEDAEKYIKIFTFLDKDTIEKLIAEHREAPHRRLLQRTLAAEVTRMVHGEEALRKAEEASQILFGKNVTEALKNLDERTLLEVFEGVPSGELPRNLLDEGMDIQQLLTASGFLPSGNEARRALKENSVWVNKSKVGPGYKVTPADLIRDKYVLLQRGKKKYFLVKFV
ncbi:MAG: tyrosine--tRNA ligase [Chlorobi bacterium]|nr:tyrosine--tRNA ligase [Chlorobiota bacterium]